MPEPRDVSDQLVENFPTDQTQGLKIAISRTKEDTRWSNGMFRNSKATIQKLINMKQNNQ